MADTYKLIVGSGLELLQDPESREILIRLSVTDGPVIYSVLGKSSAVDNAENGAGLVGYGGATVADFLDQALLDISAAQEAAENAQDAAEAAQATAESALGSGTQCIPVACSDENTTLAAGTGKITFRMPYAFTLSSVRASLTVPQTGGSIFTVDINAGGSSILSTKLTIDNGEKSSTSAATPAVISIASLSDDSEITIDIDQVGDGTAKGLKVYLIGVPA